jgi:hypothetical protein
MNTAIAKLSAVRIVRSLCRRRFRKISRVSFDAIALGVSGRLDDLNSGGADGRH